MIHIHRTGTTLADMAAHMRDAHADEATALRMERYAVTPAPEFGERRPMNG